MAVWDTDGILLESLEFEANNEYRLLLHNTVAPEGSHPEETSRFAYMKVIQFHNDVQSRTASVTMQLQEQFQ